MTEFSFIVLTYNESIHLPRLLESINGLHAPIFILDSGSTDATLPIALAAGAIVMTNAFVNHPRQWAYALSNVEIQTEWVVCLDADQIVSDTLFDKLKNFRSANHPDVNGIYFNRKNYFKGKWIKHGGYFPKYMLKMFRHTSGRSDLNENMDHRFLVDGETMIWKTGYLIEENLKENSISFWVDKHNRYSDLVAREEIERRNKLRHVAVKPRLFGSPDERITFFKSIWWQMPLYVRPFIYFFYRFFLRFGFLDGKQGFIFHYLQAFWFRLIIDIKMEEIKQEEKLTSAKI